MSLAPVTDRLNRFGWLALILGILLLGLYLRLETVAHTNIDHPFRADAGDYTAYAYNLDRHGIYSRNETTAFGNAGKPSPDAVRSPGYPVFLTLLTSPDSLQTFLTRVVYSQAFISFLSLILVLFISRHLLGNWPALIITCLCAISPHLVLANTYILTESLYIFWLLLTLLVMIKASENNETAFWILAALLLGITTLTRPTTQYFIIILAIFIWFYAPKERRTRLLAITVSVYVGIMAIWAVRNLYAIGSASDPHLMIGTLHHGMYPGLLYNGNPDTFGYPYRSDPDSKFISQSLTSVLQAIFHRFINEPAEHLAWYLSKPAYLFQWNHIQGIQIFTYPPLTSTYFAENSIFDITRKLMEHIHYVLVILSMIGALIVFTPFGYSVFPMQQRRPVQLIAALYLYFVFIHMITAPFPRYSIPVRPITYLLAISCLFIFLKKIFPQVHKIEQSEQ